MVRNYVGNEAPRRRDPGRPPCFTGASLPHCSRRPQQIRKPGQALATGQNIAIRSHGRVSHTYGWNPVLAKVCMTAVAILLLATSILFAVFGKAPYSWIKDRLKSRSFIAASLSAMSGFMVFFGILLGLTMGLLV